MLVHWDCSGPAGLLLRHCTMSVERAHQMRNIISMQVDERLDDARQDVLPPAPAQADRQERRPDKAAHVFH